MNLSSVIQVKTILSESELIRVQRSDPQRAVCAMWSATLPYAQGKSEPTVWMADM